MIKFYKSHDEIRLKIESNIVYEEVSSNIYVVANNRLDVCYSNYVNADTVVGALNNQEKVTVFGKDKIFANFELEEL